MKQSQLFVSEMQDNWFDQACSTLRVTEEPGWPDLFGQKVREKVIQPDLRPIRTLSLFSGGGGLDIGFHDAGFEIVECVETEKAFAATLRQNASPGRLLTGTKVVCQDIRSYNPNLTDIDFIIGGPPCQTFSAAGARAAGVNGLDDSRGTLFQDYVRLLLQLQPNGFLFENVYRIVGAQGGKPWELIQAAFQDAGYTLHWRILDAADYGVPQHRERLIIVGTKNGLKFRFPRPSHGPDSANNRAYYSAGKAVEGLRHDTQLKGINGRHGYLLEEIPPGLNYSYYTERMGHPRPIFGWRSKFSDYLYKADPATPVRTIKAQGGQYTGPFSWESRPFSVEELKRLQTFPDNYEVLGKRQIAIHQLGNSVPPQLGRVLGLAIRHQVFGLPLPFGMDYLEAADRLRFRQRKSDLTAVYKDKATEKIKSRIDVGAAKSDGANQLETQFVLFLTHDLRLVETKQAGAKRVSFTFIRTPKTWTISVASGRSKKAAFALELGLNPAQKDALGTEGILLSSATPTHDSVLALWKFLEIRIREVAHRDDLIQFFGYYQQKTSIDLKMHLNHKGTSDPFWKIVSMVSEGHCVAEQLHVNELIQVFCLDRDQIEAALRQMKSVGFEIRNSRTNKQMKADTYLIPYPYPTLNERSLQRSTSL
jgi:DNA (cytosine-5)-methyltransferase 1